MSRNYVYVCFEEQEQVPNRDDLISFEEGDLINWDSDHDTNSTIVPQSLPPTPDADRDPFASDEETPLQTPTLSPSETPLHNIHLNRTLSLLDTSNPADSTPSMTSMTTMSPTERLSLERHFNDSMSTVSLTWDNESSALNLQMLEEEQNLNDDNVFLSSSESEESLMNILNDNIVPADNTEGHPEDEQLDPVEEHQQPINHPAGPRTRSRSTCSDFSAEFPFNRQSRLRRPMVQAWNELNMQKIEDLPRNTARRSTQ